MNEGQVAAGIADAEAYVQRVCDALRAVPLEPVAQLEALLIDARAEGRTVFVFGNGGSASTASHMVNDLSKGTQHAGAPAVRVVGLADNMALLTAWANDASYEDVFAEQLRALGRPGDIAIAITGSGNSPNVLLGLKTARALGMHTAGLLGFDGGRAREMVDVAVVVPSYEYQPAPPAGCHPAGGGRWPQFRPGCALLPGGAAAGDGGRGRPPATGVGRNLLRGVRRRAMRRQPAAAAARASAVRCRGHTGPDPSGG